MQNLEILRLAAEMVIYNPETGKMVWRTKAPEEEHSSLWNSKNAGKECGTFDKDGYKVISFKTKNKPSVKIRAHRLAWVIVYGTIQNETIDHINQNRADNRIENLRSVSRLINQRNKLRNKNNTSGAVGVCFDKRRGLWHAQATVNYRKYHIGYFADFISAEMASREFRVKNSFTENHGRVLSAAENTHST
jgi:hypothetical protein